MFEYTLIRSRRKTISIEIDPGADLIVRAPMRAPKYEIQRFVDEKSAWIEKHMARAVKRMEKAQQTEPVSRWELRDLSEEALRVLPLKVKHMRRL